jgi:hypothetical protein
VGEPVPLARGRRTHLPNPEAKSDLSPELDLVRAPVHYEACGYELPGRKAWIVVARHQPSQTIVLRAPEAVFAYPEPMLSYCTNLPNAALASGVINLVESPRYGDLYLPAGKSGERWLHQDEIAKEEQRLLPAERGDCDKFSAVISGGWEDGRAVASLRSRSGRNSPLRTSSGTAKW